MTTATNRGRQPTLDPARLILLLAIVLTGLSAGFFYTYEISVTPGLAEISDVSYVETFQSINNTIRSPGFGIVFFGSIPALGLAAAVNWRNANQPARWLLGAGLVLYLTGLAITGTGSVPLNEELAELATVTPASAADARAAFEDSWNRLHLIRTIAFAASFLAVVLVPFVLGIETERSDPAEQV
jgi:uncharacterized membrane protein